MAKFSAYLQFTTNFLAGGPREGGIRRLEKDGNHRVMLPMEHVRKVTENIEGIEMEPYLRNVPCSLLTRVYNRSRVDKFEGVARGGKVFWVGECPKDGEELVKEYMDIVGRSGISQWGLKFNCGRFKLLEITR